VVVNWNQYQKPRWGTSACFFDYDRDGWLDLVVVNYVDYDPSRPCGDAGGKPDYCHPRQFFGTATRLFHNRGADDGGRWRGFEDRTEAAGLAARPGPGLGVLCADLDGDGWPDVLVANDAEANHLWLNRHDGTFREEAKVRGLAYGALGQPQANMGLAAGDVDGDGRLDVFCTHLTEESHVLWVQTAPGFFQDRAGAAGLAAPLWRGTGFGAVLADFDHDGLLDLAIANGRVARGAGAQAGASFWSRYAERNQVFAGVGGGKFRDVSPDSPAFCGTPGVWRGLAWGDFDGDGAVDLLVTSVAGPARLLRNVAPRRGHWLAVRAYDPARKRDALGAVVTLWVGKKPRVALVNPAQSYLCSGEPRAHFGLGDVQAIGAVWVSWPDGKAESFRCDAVDKVLTLERGKGEPLAP
jgi:hypothetical protein